MVETKLKKIEEFLFKIALEIAKDGEGALFVIGDDIKYSKLMNQRFDDFSVFSKGANKIIKSLAVIDGAVIISKEGNVVDYGAMIKGAKPFVGYGTRHAAAITASKNNNIAILCSEEERKVKVFKNGKYVMQLDSLEKNIHQDVSQAAGILESVGVGTLSTIGVATLAPTLGFALIPGILVFGGSYYTIKKLSKIHFKKKK